MIKKLTYLIIILLIPFIFACAEEEDEASSPPVVGGKSPIATEFAGQNNTAILEGGLIGTGSNANSDLYKTVDIILKNSSPYFSVGPARIARSDVSSDTSIKLILPVKNITENLAFCDVTTTGIALNNGRGEWIISNISNNKVLGSLGIADSKNASSCLAPGRTGLMLQKIMAVDSSMLSLYKDVAQLEIGSIIYGTPSVIDPNISIIPQSYTVTDEGISVVVRNTNQDYGYLWPGRSIIVLYDYDSVVPDDSTVDTPGRPLYAPGIPFHYFVFDGLSFVPYEIRPEEDATIDSGKIEFSGASYKVEIILGLGTDPWSSAYNVR